MLPRTVECCYDISEAVCDIYNVEHPYELPRVKASLSAGHYYQIPLATVVDTAGAGQLGPHFDSSSVFRADPTVQLEPVVDFLSGGAVRLVSSGTVLDAAQLDAMSSNLEQFLSDVPRESADSAAARNTAGQAVQEVVKDWMRQCIGPDADGAGGWLVSYGSSVFDLRDPSSDTDLALIISDEFRESDFFSFGRSGTDDEGVSLESNLRAHPRVTRLMAVKGSMPCLKFEMDAFAFDLLLVSVPLETIRELESAREHGDVPDSPAVARQAADVAFVHPASSPLGTRRSGFGDATTTTAATGTSGDVADPFRLSQGAVRQLLRLVEGEPDITASRVGAGAQPLMAVVNTHWVKNHVPDYHSFRALLFAVRYWAKGRGLFSAVRGFLGGGHWSFLCARVCLDCPPSTPLAVLLLVFFQRYASWDWAGRAIHFDKSWPAPMTVSITAPMVVVPPVFQHRRWNSTFTVSTSTLPVIVQELTRAASAVLSAMQSYCRQPSPTVPVLSRAASDGMVGLAPLVTIAGSPTDWAELFQVARLLRHTKSLDVAFAAVDVFMSAPTRTAAETDTGTESVTARERTLAAWSAFVELRLPAFCTDLQRSLNVWSVSRAAESHKTPCSYIVYPVRTLKTRLDGRSFGACMVLRIDSQRDWSVGSASNSSPTPTLAEIKVIVDDAFSIVKFGTLLPFADSLAPGKLGVDIKTCRRWDLPEAALLKRSASASTAPSSSLPQSVSSSSPFAQRHQQRRPPSLTGIDSAWIETDSGSGAGGGGGGGGGGGTSGLSGTSGVSRDPISMGLVSARLGVGGRTQRHSFGSSGIWGAPVGSKLVGRVSLTPATAAAPLSAKSQPFFPWSPHVRHADVGSDSGAGAGAGAGAGVGPGAGAGAGAGMGVFRAQTTQKPQKGKEKKQKQQQQQRKVEDDDDDFPDNFWA